MNGALILLTVLAAAYLALNVVRLFRGRPWAFTVCQVAKEWEELEHAKRLAMRAADRAQPGQDRERHEAAIGRPSAAHEHERRQQDERWCLGDQQDGQQRERATLGAAFLNGTPSSRDTVLTCHVTRRPAVRSRPHTRDCAPMCGGRPLVEAAKAGDRRARGQLIEAYRAARAVTPRASIGVRRL